jgi:hypothetical protein
VRLGCALFGVAGARGSGAHALQRFRKIDGLREVVGQDALGARELEWVLRNVGGAGAP